MSDLMIDNILYLLFFVGAFIMVLCLAEAFGMLCIRLIEKRAAKRYNKITREYK